jgi:hypothetical protein
MAQVGGQRACHRGLGTGKVGCCTRGRRGMLEELLPQAERIAAVLKARGETISVAESSTAGLISAALLAVPGASAYFMGGAVVYTRASRTELLRVTDEEFAALTGITPSTQPYALLFAHKIKAFLHRCDRPGRARDHRRDRQRRPGRQHARLLGRGARPAGKMPRLITEGGMRYAIPPYARSLL